MADKGYTDEEIIEAFRRVKEFGFGELKFIVKKGEVKEYTVTQSHRKTIAT